MEPRTFFAQPWLDATAPETIAKLDYFSKLGYFCEHWREAAAWEDRQKEVEKPWAFTLTTSVKEKSEWPQIEEEMKFAADRILNQRTSPVKEGIAFLEYQESGAPHIHGFYTCDKPGARIFAKVFKRQWPLWDEKIRLGKGHKGGYHAKVDDVSAYKEYISCEDRIVAAKKAA